MCLHRAVLVQVAALDLRARHQAQHVSISTPGTARLCVCSVPFSYRSQPHTVRSKGNKSGARSVPDSPAHPVCHCTCSNRSAEQDKHFLSRIMRLHLPRGIQHEPGIFQNMLTRSWRQFPSARHSASCSWQLSSRHVPTCSVACQGIKGAAIISPACCVLLGVAPKGMKLESFMSCSTAIRPSAIA